MAFSLSSLSTWTKPGDLLAKAMVTPRTGQLVQIMPGIKGSAYINPFNSAVSFQAGACSFNANSTTTIGQVTLSVDEISSHETLCVSDFNTYALSVMLAPGTSDHDDLAIVNKFMEEKAATAGYELAKMFWQGNKGTGSGNLALTNGILQKLLHTSQSASTTIQTSAVTVSNVVDTVKSIIVAANASALTRNDFTIITTTANYISYVQALGALNLYSYNPQMASNWEVPVPNFPSIKVVGLPELDGNADGVDFVAGPAKLLYWGCDLTTENEGYDIWYSQDNRAIRVALETKLGTACGIPEYFVVIK